MRSTWTDRDDLNGRAAISRVRRLTRDPLVSADVALEADAALSADRTQL